MKAQSLEYLCFHNRYYVGICTQVTSQKLITLVKFVIYLIYVISLSLCNNYEWKLLFKYLVKLICRQNKNLYNYLLIKTYYGVIIKTHPLYIENKNEPYNIITQ